MVEEHLDLAGLDDAAHARGCAQAGRFVVGHFNKHGVRDRFDSAEHFGLAGFDALADEALVAANALAAAGGGCATKEVAGADNRGFSGQLDDVAAGNALGPGGPRKPASDDQCKPFA